MKTLAFLLLAIQLATAGDLIVLLPVNDDPEEIGLNYPLVQSFAKGNFDIEPKIDIIQEGQLQRYMYRNVKPGKYRISLDAGGNPMGCVESLIETHAVVGKVGSVTVFLFAPRDRGVRLPNEIAEALEKHPKAIMLLTVRYKGSDKDFQQAHSMPRGKTGHKSWIHYLRSDGEYTVELRDIVAEDGEAATDAAYKKTFRVGGDQR